MKLGRAALDDSDDLSWPPDLLSHHCDQQHVHRSCSSGVSPAGKLAQNAMLSDDFSISKLAIPAVSLLISFLAYTSQYFFLHFESVPLRKDEVWKFNIVTFCVWVCYFRSCYVDPGRLPPNQKVVASTPQEDAQTGGRQRWCRRCEAYKPARAHHCKTCKRWKIPQPDLEWLTNRVIQVHSKNGPSLSMDQQLRLALYISPLRPVLVLRRTCHGLS